MRTALAALFLVLTATLVIVMASQGLDFLRDQILGPELAVKRSTPDVNGGPGLQDEPPAATLQDRGESSGPGNGPAVEEPVAATPPAPASDSAVEPETSTGGTAPRIVGGAGITPGPLTGGPLQRVAPVQKPARPPEPVRWLAFPRVTITGAGLIDAGKRTIRLAWVTPPDRDMMCRVTPEVAAEQPCARLALIAFRKRVRALGVECQLSPDDPADPATVPCRIGATDLGLWLVEQGWVGVESGAPDDYHETELRARCAARGIWQDARRPDNCPQP